MEARQILINLDNDVPTSGPVQHILFQHVRAPYIEVGDQRPGRSAVFVINRALE